MSSRCKSSQFNNDLDLIRFRSVCWTWRSSSISNHHRPNLVPFKIKHFEFHCPSSSYFLSKHSLLLIKPPTQQQNLRPWLIRITQNSCGETQLFHPLRPCEYPCPYDFPYVLDFNKFSHVVHWEPPSSWKKNQNRPSHNCAYGTAPGEI